MSTILKMKFTMYILHWMYSLKVLTSYEWVIVGDISLVLWPHASRHSHASLKKDAETDVWWWLRWRWNEIKKIEVETCHSFTFSRKSEGKWRSIEAKNRNKHIFNARLILNFKLHQHTYSVQRISLFIILLF